MNANRFEIQWGLNLRLNKVKASGGCLRFSKEIYRASSIKSGRKYAKAHLIKEIQKEVEISRKRKSHPDLVGMTHLFFDSFLHANED